MDAGRGVRTETFFLRFMQPARARLFPCGRMSRPTMTPFALEVEHLVKVYHPRGRAPVRAVNGMSFSVAPGAIFGLLGPNGAGKSTILRMLTTLSKPSSGTARVAGFDVVERTLEVRRRIAAVLQETAVELFLSVRDNLLTYARFHGLGRATAVRRAGDVMERFHLGSQADNKVQDLSGGFCRPGQVGQTILGGKPLLFFDEISTGVGPLLKSGGVAPPRAEARPG